jgi:uncharacterized protein YcbK (DUF882 family)
MTQSVDPTTPPVNHTMSRRRFLKMGAIVAALGFAGSTAVAGTRGAGKSSKTASKGQGRKTTHTADRSAKFAHAKKPIRSEIHARTTERSGPPAPRGRYTRKTEPHPRHAAHTGAQRPASSFAHIERASRKVEPTPVVAQAERPSQRDLEEKPLRNPLVQAEKSSVVTPSTSFTRPAYPVQSDYNVSTPRSFAKMERYLEFYNTHTGESLKTVYWAVGKYLPSALRDVNWLLRDHHSNDTIAMDPDLLDLLYNLSITLEVRPSFQVVSAYRSPATNARLRMFSSGVAEHSQHIKGKAVDIRMPGCSVATIRRAALELQAGGVGYYPWSNFVHLDTGPVRSWLA